ncbi:MAG: hypothetical protein ACI9EK_002526, partial [Psychroserpens sp.]
EQTTRKERLKAIIKGANTPDTLKQ